MANPNTPPDPAGRPDRRALLRRIGYLVPAVAGTFVVSRSAAAQASCVPSASCRPDICGPNTDCGPELCGPVVPCRPAMRGG